MHNISAVIILWRLRHDIFATTDYYGSPYVHTHYPNVLKMVRLSFIIDLTAKYRYRVRYLFDIILTQNYM